MHISISHKYICPECNQEYTNIYYGWCKPCNSKHFQNDLNKWTSGNDKIDKFIQDAQLNANRNWDVIEWIPYDRFKDVKQIDIENQQWKRYREEEEKEVALKNPETHSYMMVLDYATDGNLREYLKNNFNNINWLQKLYYLWDLSSRLSKLIGANLNSPEKKNIFGVLPYIAPEVLSGDEYTKAADIYSFGIIVYEIVTGFPPYPDIPHDKNLAMKICNGLRQKIPFHTPKLITRMIMRCWDARVTHRPTFKEYEDYFYEAKNKDSEIVIQIKKAEEFSENQESTNTTTTITTPLDNQTHPQAIYTSRLLDYSNLLKPKNEENFERELVELTKSMSNLCPSNSDLIIHISFLIQ
ncbi:hypothetical protein Glove_13g186 [Diversispora epigaea]|uniref:Protein kinase domain-containing protein n=1 Tax=Diversispora epigaea TaxID=1348612 RepID=A0A397JRZ2_9GLOM|nr:hypothetical protein Glove_13g186 [Diversispora epigaea]